MEQAEKKICGQDLNVLPGMPKIHHSIYISAVVLVQNRFLEEQLILPE